MALMRIQVRLPRDGGAPEDDAVNVWHFDSDQSFADDADDTVNRLLAFYNAIDAHLSPALSGAIHFKVYDMEASEPRVPVYTQTGALTLPGGSPLPAEVAICLSMFAEPVSGQNQRRRRGRIFLGPLSNNVVAAHEAGAPDVLVDATVVATICGAAADLATGPDAGDARLAVYSPTTDLTGTTADAFNDVTGGWVDNAFDTQRRRGSDATIRTAWVPS